MQTAMQHVWMVQLFLVSSGTLSNAYNLLIIYPFPAISHQRPILALTEALIKKGHSVTAVTPNPVLGMEGNYTFIDLSFAYEYFSPSKETSIKVDLTYQSNKYDYLIVYAQSASVYKKLFSSDSVTKFMKKVKTEKNTFDAVILETIFTEFTTAFAEIVAGPKPLIGFSSIGIDFFRENSLGSIEHYSFIPSFFSGYTDKMTFWEKIENWYSHQYIVSKVKEMDGTITREFLKDHYGEERAINIADSVRRISISMLSSNFLYYYPRMLAPNVVQLGPMHLRTPPELPQVLQNWCDGAEKGIIYFSFGSIKETKSMSKSVRDNFLRIFKELPDGYRILWKWESDDGIPEKNANVMTRKWFPQQSVLAHPKVKLFITHGGLSSFQETVHYGVPTVGIPWFLDQELNVAKMVDAGIGALLHPRDLLSYQKVKLAINSVLFDERFSNNMKKYSAISRDFSSRSLDTAVFWVEHIAKHGGGDHLRPVTANTTYFEFFCLDIVLFICISLAMIFCSVLFLFKSIFSLILAKTINLKVKSF